jgi:hypothetical protein
MAVVYHLRNVARDRVREAIDQQLRSEGFVVATTEDLAVDENVPSWSRRPRKEIREITLYEENGWVGIADDQHASTAWGARLSRGFEVPVVKLTGECDHAFYSEAILFENGEQTAQNRVPADAMLDEEGRHRVRPTFLTALVPESREVLESGVVVRELGGEENIEAVGAALGIPRPLVRRWEPADPDLTVVYKYAGRDAATGAPFGIEGELESEADPLGARKQLAALALGLELTDDLAADPLAALLAGVVTKMSGVTRNAIIGGDSEDFELEDDGEDASIDGWTVVSCKSRVSEGEGNAISVLVNGGGTRIGARVGFEADVSLGFGEADVVHGVIVELSGPGLAVLDVETLDAYRPFSDAAEVRLSAKAEREGDALIFRFPELHLERPDEEPALPASKRPPPAEALRQNMQRSVRDMMGVDPSSIKIGAYAPAKRTGEGELRIAVRTLEPPSLSVEYVTLAVREPIRIPALPAWVAPDEQHLETYAARDALVGWMAWDGTWSDVAALAETIVADIAKVALASASGKAAKAKGFEARVRRRGGEELTFKAPVAPSGTDRTWKKIRTELARGADVTISLPRERGREHASISLVHQPHGSNYSDDMAMDRGDLGLPPVILTFMVPRPETETARKDLGEITRRVLARAGESAASLGGFAIAGPRYPMTNGTAFEEMLGLHPHDTDDRNWVRFHVRTPGWAVLAPKQAALPERKPGPRVEVTRLAHATLITATTEDPFAMAVEDLEAVERFVMPALGSEAEIRAILAAKA